MQEECIYDFFSNFLFLKGVVPQLQVLPHSTYSSTITHLPTHGASAQIVGSDLTRNADSRCQKMTPNYAQNVHTTWHTKKMREFLFVSVRFGYVESRCLLDNTPLSPVPLQNNLMSVLWAIFDKLLLIT